MKNLIPIIKQLKPLLMKKMVYLKNGKNINITKLLDKKIETIFFRGLIIDEFIEIETEIEDIILNEKFGVNFNKTKSKRDIYREYKLRKKGTHENKFEDKLNELRKIQNKYLNKSESKDMNAYISETEQYRHYFSHKEIKFDSSNAFLYFEGVKKERRIKLTIKFIKEILSKTKKLKELLNKIKNKQ